MLFIKSAHYEHACIGHPQKGFEDKPISISGASGRGKNITVAEYCEDLYEYGNRSILDLTDIQDVYENSYYVMFFL